MQNILKSSMWIFVLIIQKLFVCLKKPKNLVQILGYVLTIVSQNYNINFLLPHIFSNQYSVYSSINYFYRNVSNI
ncbi:unnamed protein product [Schistosoma curassoni]|uniref:Uncharacterized protein n=1 Tax=Schistosoma curassoni TaxID=6186 RepID=A0A183KVW4_9TREM|nr:unnamed protein product [Schistosoma curassoni]